MEAGQNKSCEVTVKRDLISEIIADNECDRNLNKSSSIEKTNET